MRFVLSLVGALALFPALTGAGPRDNGRVQTPGTLLRAAADWPAPWRRRSRRAGFQGSVIILLGWRKIPAAAPRIQFRPGGVDRAHPVMQVPVDGHPLPLLPALDRGHVAVEVSRDLLPRIEGIFGRSLGWRCGCGWLVHRALLTLFVVVASRGFRL